MISNKEKSQWPTAKTKVLPTIAGAIQQRTVPPSCVSPNFHDALIVTSNARYEIVKLAKPSHVADNEVVAETRAVGLNPIDWKSVDLGMCLLEFP